MNFVRSVTVSSSPWLLIAAGAVAALSSSCMTAPDSDAESPANAGYGESRRTAVEVCKPDGEHAYLARLVCPTGEQATFDRVGTYGPRNDLPEGQSVSDLVASARRDPLQPGEVDYHAVDGYEVTCGDSRQLIYLDMYHCHQPPPKDAPPGYSLR